jgi:hypothetical protein
MGRLIPGFSAQSVLGNEQLSHSQHSLYAHSIEIGKVEAAGSRGCGFAIALLAGGLITGNPSFILGGVAGIASWC